MELPLDDAALSLYLEALDCVIESMGPDGPVMSGDITLPRLLAFYSGHDPSLDTFVGYASGDIPVYESAGIMFSERDLIRALIDEVIRLRQISEF